MTEYEASTPESYNPLQIIRVYRSWVKTGDKAEWNALLDEGGHREGLESYLGEVLTAWHLDAAKLPHPPKLRRGPRMKGEITKISVGLKRDLYTKVYALTRGQKVLTAVIRLLRPVIARDEGIKVADRLVAQWKSRLFDRASHRRYKTLRRFLYDQTERCQEKRRIRFHKNKARKVVIHARAA